MASRDEAGLEKFEGDIGPELITAAEAANQAQ